MIFVPINNTSTSQDKAFFEELISIYCKIVREICYKNNIPYLPRTIALTEDIISEIKEMGVIMDYEQILFIQKSLKELFDLFIYSVSLVISHRRDFGNVLDKLSNAKRKIAQANEKISNKPKLVDFFAGAGGLSCGFVQAGYTVSFANDFEEVCVNTYKYNHPEVPADKILKADIRTIVDNITDYINEDVDIVVGGPPCQGFSSANQQRIIDDPRNELYKYFLRAVEKLAPKFVVMENVRGMLSVADQVVEDYENIRVQRADKVYTYKVMYKLLNSASFSVAQSRERLIYIAIRNDISQEYNVAASEIFEQISNMCVGNKVYTLSDALEFIKPLNAPRVKNTNEVDDESTGKKIDNNTFTGCDNEYLKLINQGRNIPLVFNHKARYVNEINYDIYRLLQPGEDATNEKIADIMPYKHRLHCFKDKYYKLIPNKPSRTITAHLRMDCHSHIHPFQVRAITPREAARCQSFPDDYLFLGAYLKTYMEIGNAVPCLMAKQIATIIKQYL